MRKDIVGSKSLLLRYEEQQANSEIDNYLGDILGSDQTALLIHLSCHLEAVAIFHDSLTARSIVAIRNTLIDRYGMSERSIEEEISKLLE